MKDEIKIRSTVNRELSTSVVINGKKYLILTEDLIPQKQLVNTRVYLDGKIISSRNLDCKSGDFLSYVLPEFGKDAPGGTKQTGCG